MAIKQAKVFTITSVKGGVGKTVTTLNLAAIFSIRKVKTVILDLDLYTGGIDLLLKLNPKRNLFDIIDDLNNNQFSSIEDYICSYNEYIDAIVSPKDPRDANKINAKYLSLILSKLKMKYDVVLIDTNHFMNDINLITFDSSDQIIYIVDNDLVGCKNMRSMVSIYSDMEKANYMIIYNESTNKQKGYFTKYDIKNMIGTSIDYTIPSSFYIKNIERYFLDGKIPLLDKKTRKYYKMGTQNLEKLSNALYQIDEKEEIKKEKFRRIKK